LATGGVGQTSLKFIKTLTILNLKGCQIFKLRNNQFIIQIQISGRVGLHSRVALGNKLGLRLWELLGLRELLRLLGLREL
jgi:hypothetical protein